MPSLIKEKRRRAIKPAIMPRATPKRLFTAICEVMGVSEQEAASKCRDDRLVKARAIYAYIGREFKFPCTEMATLINKDHATILHHAKAYTGYLDETKPWFRPELKEKVVNIKRRLKTRLINCE